MISLIHSSQESKDVRDKLGDLVQWLTKIKDGVLTTSAGDNREEAEGRAQLTRFPPRPSRRRPKPIICARSLESIEKRSQMLLGKGKGARILDKKKDSGTVVKLVEELRQAVLIYQVGTFWSQRSS